MRRINGLAYCAQEVMTAVEDMKEASIGAEPAARHNTPAAGFERSGSRRILNLRRRTVAAWITGVAREMAALDEPGACEGLQLAPVRSQPNLEELERHADGDGRKALQRR